MHVDNVRLRKELKMHAFTVPYNDINIPYINSYYSKKLLLKKVYVNLNNVIDRSFQQFL